MLPAIGQEINLPYSNREGWLSGIFEKVQKKRGAFYLRSLLSSGGSADKAIEGKKVFRTGNSLLCF